MIVQKEAVSLFAAGTSFSVSRRGDFVVVRQFSDGSAGTGEAWRVR